MSEAHRPSRRPRAKRRPQVQELEQRVVEATGEAFQVDGVLDVLPEGYGFLRVRGYAPSPGDAYVARSQIQRLGLRPGDRVAGLARRASGPKESCPALHEVTDANGQPLDMARSRPSFDDLPAPPPAERIRLERESQAATGRILDLLAPVGKGQRGLVVSPPKAGKTTVLRELARSIVANHPDIHLIVLLVDERPEEGFDWSEALSGDGEVVASTFDRPLREHLQVAELVLATAKRRAELGEDVVILLDSLTRMTRAYNLASPVSGRVLTGGIEAAALDPPKRFFGAARDLRGAGSLTIIASCLVDTGSRADEVIFEEFKGRGNMEVRLDRALAEKRLFPAVNVEATSTRNEERLLSPQELAGVWRLRRVLHAVDAQQALDVLLENMRQSGTNAQFLERVARVG